MASFQIKIGWKRPRKREYKNYRFVSFRPDAQEKIQKKIAKKFNKLKNTTMASFKAKTGWKRLRERKLKLSWRFVPIRCVREN